MEPVKEVKKKGGENGLARARVDKIKMKLKENYFSAFLEKHEILMEGKVSLSMSAVMPLETFRLPITELAGVFHKPKHPFSGGFPGMGRVEMGVTPSISINYI